MCRACLIRTRMWIWNPRLKMGEVMAVVVVVVGKDLRLAITTAATRSAAVEEEEVEAGEDEATRPLLLL